MLRLFAIFVMILFAAISSADVCSYVTKEQAELGARLLRINPNFVKYCAPCSDKSKSKVRAEKIEARPVENNQYWAVFVNEENIDLAYSYLDIGEKNGISLANLSGCQTPYDVPRMIDITDVAAAAEPEIKPVQPQPAPVQPEPKPAQPEVIPAQPETKLPQPEIKPAQPDRNRILKCKRPPPKMMFLLRPINISKNQILQLQHVSMKNFLKRIFRNPRC
jgi:hypothetical protein